MDLKAKKTVGILGGTFDPPTISHISIVREALLQSAVDEVWIIPCGYRLDKTTTLTSPQNRLAMTELAVKSVISRTNPELMEKIKVNDIEVKNGASITSYELVLRLSSEHPELDFWFIIGSDLVGSLCRWRNAEKLIEEVGFIVMAMGGFSLEGASFPLPKRWKLFRIQEDVRSTEYRETILKNRDLPGLGLPENHLAQEVIQFIQDNDLFRISKPPE